MIESIDMSADRRQHNVFLWALVAALVLVAIVVVLIVRSCAQSDAQSTNASRNQQSLLAQSDASAVIKPYDVHLDDLIVDGKPLTDTQKSLLANAGATYTEDPVEYLQVYEMESGCEITALASALISYGFDVTATELADDYLIVDGDYEFGYLASPYTDFGGGFPPGVAQAANAYLEAQNSPLVAHVLSGSTFASLRALVQAGYPVLVWTTLDQMPPDYDEELGAIDDWYVNEHCMTVYEVTDDYVVANDPLQGIVELDADVFADVYEQCGSYALAIW